MREELNLFFDDHYRHFGCYPLDFEFEGVVYDWERCWQILNDEEVTQ